MNRSLVPVVDWCGDFPRELRAVVEPLLAASLDLAPRWCREMTVWYKNEADSPAAIDTESTSDYGIAKLIIGPDFLEHTERERIAVIDHEMLHIAQSPMYSVFDDVMEHLRKHGEKSIAGVFAKQFERATERANCDVCDILERRRVAP